MAAGAAEEPLRWPRRFARLAGSGYMEAAIASLAALPALPPERRFRIRTEAMTMLAGDVLEPELLSRSTKARFDAVFWAGASREVAAAWDGEGVDPEIVDAERLRAEWAAERPDSHSCTLLQSAWLASDRQLEQPLAARGE